MRKILFAAALAGLAAAAPAHAWQGGRVLFVHSLSDPVKISIDGVSMGAVAPDGTLDRPLAAGVHTIAVETASGERRSATWTFRPETLADAKGARYWCIYLQKGETPKVAGVFTVIQQEFCGMMVEAPA